MLMPPLRRARGMVPAVVLAALALGACGGGDDTAGDGVASLDDATTDDSAADPSDGASDDSSAPASTEPVDTEEAMLEFAACMRENGVDMADPQVDENGGVIVQMGEGPGDGPQDGMDEAFEACEDKMPRGPIARNGDDFDPTAMQDELLAFAQCMRDNGIDMPDPDFDEDGRLSEGAVTDEEEVDGDESGRPGRVLRGPFGELDLSDPATEEAFETCSEGTMFAGPPGGGAAVGAAPVEGDE